MVSNSGQQLWNSGVEAKAQTSVLLNPLFQVVLPFNIRLGTDSLGKGCGNGPTNIETNGRV